MISWIQQRYRNNTPRETVKKISKEGSRKWKRIMKEMYFLHGRLDIKINGRDLETLLKTTK